MWDYYRVLVQRYVVPLHVFVFLYRRASHCFLYRCHRGYHVGSELWQPSAAKAHYPHGILYGIYKGNSVKHGDKETQKHAEEQHNVALTPYSNPTSIVKSNGRDPYQAFRFRDFRLLLIG